MHGWRKILGSKRDKKPGRKMGWNEKMRHEAFPFQTRNLISWCEVVHRNRIPNCALFVALKMQMEAMRKKIEWGEREKKEKLTKERELLKERGYEVNRLNNRSKNRNTLSKT